MKLKVSVLSVPLVGLPLKKIKNDRKMFKFKGIEYRKKLPTNSLLNYTMNLS